MEHFRVGLKELPGIGSLTRFARDDASSMKLKTFLIVQPMLLGLSGLYRSVTIVVIVIRDDRDVRETGQEHGRSHWQFHNTVRDFQMDHIFH